MRNAIQMALKWLVFAKNHKQHPAARTLPPDPLCDALNCISLLTTQRNEDIFRSNNSLFWGQPPSLSKILAVRML